MSDDNLFGGITPQPLARYCIGEDEPVTTITTPDGSVVVIQSAQARAEAHRDTGVPFDCYVPGYFTPVVTPAPFEPVSALVALVSELIETFPRLTP